MTANRSAFLSDAPAVYRIRVHGRVGSDWAESLAGLSIAVRVGADKSPTTTLTGCLVDQASLIGVLTTLYELGFTLLNVRRMRDVPALAAEPDTDRVLA